jgi:hypothetical protein
MPSRHAQRQAIRETWMNKTFWEFEENLDMHLIFLLGKDGTEISEEEKIYNDILMIDFNESHYNLSVKDYSLFSYIDEHCKNIDYLFKGDDDILLVPENAIYHLNMLKNHPVIYSIARADFFHTDCGIRVMLGGIFDPNRFYNAPFGSKS